MPQFAVIDVETTGLSAAHHHRVVEIAVVLVDEQGEKVHEWDTVINPQRDVGAQDVHGLTATDVYDAPTFADVAGDVASLLSQRVLVAHNASFDIGFLVAEFARMGVLFPLHQDGFLCTMRLARHYLPVERRSLAACCQHIDYHLTDAHAALADARATAALLGYYIRKDEKGFGRTWGDTLRQGRQTTWPNMPKPSGRRLSRKHVRTTTNEHFLGRLATRAPRPIVQADVEPYLEVLDRVLLNRYISRHEADELVAVAGSMGLSRQDAVAAHRLYLTALCRQALADGVVTKEERADLMRVQTLLGLHRDEVDVALAQMAAAGDSTDETETMATQIGTFQLQPGDGIVFTGNHARISRKELEARSKAAGLRVVGSVSRRTRLLVAADPDSISSKARRARELEVPVVDVDAYVRMLDEMDDPGG